MTNNVNGREARRYDRNGAVGVRAGGRGNAGACRARRQAKAGGYPLIRPISNRANVVYKRTQ